MRQRATDASRPLLTLACIHSFRITANSAVSLPSTFAHALIQLFGQNEELLDKRRNSANSGGDHQIFRPLPVYKQRSTFFDEFRLDGWHRCPPEANISRRPMRGPGAEPDIAQASRVDRCICLQPPSRRLNREPTFLRPSILRITDSTDHPRPLSGYPFWGLRSWRSMIYSQN